jgi:hypothetical protein
MCGTCSIRGRDIKIVLHQFENLKLLGHTRDPEYKLDDNIKISNKMQTCNRIYYSKIY